MGIFDIWWKVTKQCKFRKQNIKIKKAITSNNEKVLLTLNLDVSRRRRTEIST